MALKQSVGEFLMSNQSKPVYLKLRDMIAAAIIDGRYAEGDMLPSVRALAAEQGANPLTVAKAYQQFQNDGLVEVQRGVGMYVVDGAAERLRRSGDGENLIARLGGDEFVVVPRAAMDEAAATALAHQLQSALREQVSIDGEVLTRTVSIGVAQGTPGVDTTSDLLRRADQAVLTAKNSGGNKVAVFTDGMAMKNEFGSAIE